MPRVTLACLVQIRQLQGVGLLVKFDDLLIMIHSVHRAQFNGLVLKLHHHFYLFAGIQSTNIPDSPLNASDRWRKANACKQINGCSFQTAFSTPLLKLRWVQHHCSPMTLDVSALTRLAAPFTRAYRTRMK